MSPEAPPKAPEKAIATAPKPDVASEVKKVEKTEGKADAAKKPEAVSKHPYTDLWKSLIGIRDDIGSRIEWAAMLPFRKIYEGCANVRKSIAGVMNQINPFKKKA